MHDDAGVTMQCVRAPGTGRGGAHGCERLSQRERHDANGVAPAQVFLTERTPDARRPDGWLKYVMPISDFGCEEDEIRKLNKIDFLVRGARCAAAAEALRPPCGSKVRQLAWHATRAAPAPCLGCRRCATQSSAWTRRSCCEASGLLQAAASCREACCRLQPAAYAYRATSSCCGSERASLAEGPSCTGIGSANQPRGRASSSSLAISTHQS